MSEGDNVWDIGANTGLFSFAAAYKAGPDSEVYSFEADTWLVRLLNETAQENADLLGGRVKPVPAAISNTNGIGSLSIANRGCSANFLSNVSGSTSAGGERHAQPVVQLSMDWLGERISVPDVIKIDVEGAEKLVLEGGMGLLEEARPIILCETFEETRTDVADILQGLDYTFLDGGIGESFGEEIEEMRFETVALPK